VTKTVAQQTENVKPNPPPTPVASEEEMENVLEEYEKEVEAL
jgi:hypothetical protein